jgi:hypothetical protein
MQKTKFIVSWTEIVKNSIEVMASSETEAIQIANSGEFDDGIFTECVDRDDDSFRAYPA